MSDINSDSEEEILVYVEFDENMKIDKYRTIHALGVDSKNPIIQMDDTFCTGNYESPVGTYLFFEQDSNNDIADQLFEKPPENPLKYLCKTRKYIKMQHAYVTLKDGAEDKEVTSDANDCDNDIQIENFNTLQEAINKFKNSWKPTEETHEVTELVNKTKNLISTSDDILS